MEDVEREAEIEAQVAPSLDLLKDMKDLPREERKDRMTRAMTSLLCESQAAAVTTYREAIRVALATMGLQAALSGDLATSDALSLCYKMISSDLFEQELRRKAQEARDGK